MRIRTKTPAEQHEAARRIAATEASLPRLPGSPWPFACTNCGHKPTPQSVVDQHGDCEKCGDTVLAYTVDAAECINRLCAALTAARDQRPSQRWQAEIIDAALANGPHDGRA